MQCQSGAESTPANSRRAPFHVPLYTSVVDGELTWKELLERVPIGGRRPDATLKRLRRAGLLPKPTPRSLGRGRGVAQLYPSWTEQRLRRIVTLRSEGVRAELELLWWLWFEGADDLWPAVQRHLLLAYPRSEQKALEEMEQSDPEGLADAVDHASTALAREWSNPHNPGYDRRAIKHKVDVETLAHVAIGAAIEGEEPYLPGPLDDTESGETVGGLVDRAWGHGSASVLDLLMDAGVLDPSRWEHALSSATASEARVAALLLGQGLSTRQLSAEMRRLRARWVNRALLMAVGLFAISRGIKPEA